MPYRKSIKLEEPDEFVEKVLERYREDLSDRSDWAQDRIQRYAKLYNWREPKNYPWPNASNQSVTMLMSNSLRTQDTLVNAVLAGRPIMSAIAVNKGDVSKGQTIDDLQDYQLFVEQNGEEKIATLAESFTNDGRWVCFVPWVRDSRMARETIPVPSIPENTDPDQYYLKSISDLFPAPAYAEPIGGGKYTILLPKSDQTQKPEEIKAEFCVEDDRTYLIIERERIIFDGPCPIPKALEDIIVPSRCENLQPPGPSNPMGADHVIMVDYPQWDEINRLAKKGYYDLLTSDDLDALTGRVEGEAGTSTSGTDFGLEQQKVQKDALAGQTFGNAKTASKIFTRLTYFGRWHLPGQDFEDEVVARVIMSDDGGMRFLARLKRLDEEFPRQDLSRPRPFACSPGFIPIPGQWFAWGLPQLLEGLQDFTKTTLDQMVDKHTMCNTPFGFYRASSGLRPETIRMEPGMFFPVSNPQQDVAFPQMPMGDQSVAMNLIAMAQQWSERLSMQGALQMGGVPQGKASALRTSTNMMSVLQQGDARPERILRRFFLGLADLYSQMHELNKIFLSPNKQYRITGIDQPGADPYKTIENPSEIGGIYQFDFKANSLNTSKAAKNQILSQLVPTLINGMTMQMGLVTQEEVYNILSDIIKSAGQDETRYLKTPPNANIPKITAEQALQQMLMGEMPTGRPAEGAQTHLQTMQQLLQDPRLQQVIQLDPAFMVIFQSYAQKVQQQALQEQQQAQAAQAYSEAMGGGGNGQPPGPQGSVEPNADQMSPQGPGQVMDESLPGAKGQM